MRIGTALRELFGAATQVEIADRLTKCGMATDQTKVSAWLRGRVPNIEQLNAIEDCYRQPHGTILAMAGFIDVAALSRMRIAVVGTGSAGSSQFAVAAYGADGRPPKDRGRRVNRPQPAPESG